MKMIILLEAINPFLGFLSFLLVMAFAVLIYYLLINVFNVSVITRSGDIIDPIKVNKKKAQSQLEQIERQEITSILQEYKVINYKISTSRLSSMESIFDVDYNDTMKIISSGNAESIINSIKALRELRESNVLDQKEYKEKFNKIISEVIS